MIEFTDTSELSVEYSPIKGKFSVEILSPLYTEPKRLIGSSKKFALVEEFNLSEQRTSAPYVNIRAKNKFFPGISFSVEYKSKLIGFVVPKLTGIGPFLFGKIVSFENTNKQEIAYVGVPKFIQQLMEFLPHVDTRCPLKIKDQTLEHLFLNHNFTANYNAKLTLSQEVVKCIDPWLLIAGMALVVKQFGES